MLRLKHIRSSPLESCQDVFLLIPVVLTDEVWESPLCCVFSTVSKLDTIDFGLNSFLGRLLAVDILREQMPICVHKLNCIVARHLFILNTLITSQCFLSGF